MESQEDPYAVLGVGKDASVGEIKKAYRKLALKWHPDKQQEADKKTATVMFAKISNAYEILGDEQRRKEYDDQAAGFGSDPFAPRASRTAAHPRTSATHRTDFGMNDFHFHDPFEIFAQVFGDEFGGIGEMHRRQHDSFASSGLFGGFGGFSDPFFGNGAGGPVGSLFGGSLFGPQGMDPFGSPMTMHHNAMNMMNGGMSSTSFVSSTSTNFGTDSGDGKSPIVSQSTSTRIVNGQRTTEVVIQRADGSVERRVESSTQQIGNGGGSHNVPRLPQNRRATPRSNVAPQRSARLPASRATSNGSSNRSHGSSIDERQQQHATVDDYGDEDDDIATEFDVCLGDDNHPGTIELHRAINRALQKYPNDASNTQRYTYIRKRLNGRRYFVVTPGRMILLHKEQVRDTIVHMLNDQLTRLNEAAAANRVVLDSTIGDSAAAALPNDVAPVGKSSTRVTQRGNSLEELHYQERSPPKRRR